jgi:hypothetical protein
MEKRASPVLVALVLLPLAFLGCSQPAGQSKPEEPPSLPKAGPWSGSDLASMLASLKLYASIFGGASSSYSTYLDRIESMIGDYVTRVRAKPVYSVSSTRLSYSTTYAEGGSSKTWEGLSGLVLVPSSPGGQALSAPVIAFQHGTQIHWRNAPSRFDPDAGATLMDFKNPEKGGAMQNYVECLVGIYMAAAGYIVAMPDYPGFGGNRDVHPYVQASLGDVVRDAVKAAAASSPWSGKVAWNGRVYLIGYSEGGYATMAGAKSIQLDRSTTSLSAALRAVAPCDGPYDLSGTMATRIADGTPELSSYYVPYVLVGLHEIYGDSSFPYAGILKESYATSLPPLFDGTHSGAEISAALAGTLVSGTSPTRYEPRLALTSQAIADLTDASSALHLALEASDAYRGWLPSMRMEIVHCASDDIVPYANAAAAYADFIGRGADPRLVALKEVQPVDSGDATSEVHLRAFPSAIAEGFRFIDGIEAAAVGARTGP